MREVTTALQEVPVVAILRAAGPERLNGVARALVEEGLRAIEFPLTTPGAAAAIARFAAEASDDVAVGAGTVRSIPDVHTAADAGADFVVTPDTFAEVIEEAKLASMTVIAGAFTATEITGAGRAGADAIKVFPASLGGPAYIAALQAPFPDVRLVPTGGVGIDDAAAFLEAGAFGLGIGGPLVGKALDSEDIGALRERTRSLMRAISGGSYG